MPYKKSPKGTKKGAKKALVVQSNTFKSQKGVTKAINKSSLQCVSKKGKSNVPSYDLQSDRTLTKAQQNRGTFKSTKFRADSNATVHGYSSGYHEVLPTDLYLKLENLAKNKVTQITIVNKPITVNMKAVEKIVEIADGFRTDTAQTLMSAMGEKVAPHAGSLTKTPHQAEAHNLLREVVRDMIDTKSPIPKGRTQKSMAVVLGSLAVSSIAPGDQVRSSGLKFDNLKAKQALQQWEQNRNKAKSAVNSVFHTLSPDEKNFVSIHMKRYFEKIRAKTNPSRTLKPKRPVSPHRQTTNNQPSISGGKYISKICNNKLSQLDYLEPKDIKHLGLYFTRDFRASRGKPSI